MRNISMLIILLTVCPIVYAQFWNVECISCPRYISDAMSENYIACDSTNQIHIAYPGETLFYQYFNGSAWNNANDLILTGTENVNLAVSASGQAHCTFTTVSSGDLEYAVLEGTDWIEETIASGDDSFFTAIAIDSAGYPHITYAPRYIHGTLSYTYKDSGGWHTISLPEAGHPGSMDVTIDSSDHVHLVLHNSVSPSFGNLVYGYYDGSIWSFEVIDQSESTGSRPSLTIDSSNEIHVTYLDTDYQTLKYATGHYGDWTVETISDAYDFISIGGIGIRSDGYPATAGLINTGSGQLVVFYKDGSGWNADSTAVDNLLTISATTGTDGLFHVSSLRNDGNLLYLREAVPEWESTVLDTSAMTGSSLSQTIDSQGDYHAVFKRFDTPASTPSVYYGYQDGSDWQLTEVIPASTCCIEQVRVSVDSLNRPRLACHYSAAENSIDHMFFDGSVWQTETVISHNASNPAIAIDSADRSVIAYSDSSTPIHELKVATRGTTGWSFETAYTAGSFLNDIHLSIDSGDRPHLAMTASMTHRYLIYVYRDNSGWHSETVADFGYSVYPISMTLSDDDRPQICYVDQSDNLYFATKSANTWSTEIVTSRPDIHYVAIRMLSTGLPVIAFTAGEEIHSTYIAYFNGSSWTTEFTQLLPSLYTNVSLSVNSTDELSIWMFDYMMMDAIRQKRIPILPVPSMTWPGVAIAMTGLGFLIASRKK